jgi:hypothetical protein
MIMKSVTGCPIFGDDFSPDDEFSAYVTGKSPWSEKSSRSCKADDERVLVTEFGRVLPGSFDRFADHRVGQAARIALP